MRSVIHFYIRSFCALLEQLRNPEISDKPVVVTHRSAVGEFVLSASPEAELQGVNEGMTSRRASRYCPDGVFLPADLKMYRDASERVLNILSIYSPLLEPQGLDRAFMETTGCSSLFGSPKKIAKDALEKVEREIGPLSIGIARNKLTAKAAASVCGTGKFLTVRPGKERDFLSPLPVESLPGVGLKLRKRLFTLGIITIGDLAAVPEYMLERQLGVFGGKLHKLALGMDYSPVLALYPPEVIITEHTFALSCEPDCLQPYLVRMADELSAKARNRNQKAGRVSLRLEFEGEETADSSYVPKSPISSTREIYMCIKRMLSMEMPDRIVSIRLTLGDLRSAGGLQLSLTNDPERKVRLDILLNNVRSKFGERSLIYGSDLLSA